MSTDDNVGDTERELREQHAALQTFITAMESMRVTDRDTTRTENEISRLIEKEMSNIASTIGQIESGDEDEVGCVEDANDRD